MHWQYLRAVIRHKRFVYEAGRKLGVSRWQLLIHDWSKFLPSEWGPYAEWFYGHPGHKPEESPVFRAAWLRHQKRNPHHWQYWVIMEDSGRVEAMPMPRKYLLEMVADWRGANRAYGDQSMYDWYVESLPARQLHPDTKDEVERLLFGFPFRRLAEGGARIWGKTTRQRDAFDASDLYTEEQKAAIRQFWHKELGARQ